MNLLHWRLLVAVADAGNISRAAEEIGMTQSGASQAIAQLESSLGFSVFIRERRYIGVTALGGQVVEHARNMLSQLNAIRELADESRGLNRGRIRLASFPSVTSTLLPGLLRDFKRLHPGIDESRTRPCRRCIRAGCMGSGTASHSSAGTSCQDVWHNAKGAGRPALYSGDRRMRR